MSLELTRAVKGISLKMVMATITEKRNGTLAFGTILLLCYGTFCLECKQGFCLEWACALFLFGALGGFRLAAKYGSKNDTVIYHLRHRRRIVYVGIAFERRVGLRVNEHKQSGKCFDRVDIGRARPRAEALRLESRRIRRMQPKYNIAGK